jgi:cyclase
VVRTNCGRTASGLDPVDWARQVQARGAGEILLNSVDRDGTLEGYDLDLVRAVASAVNIPVIASGGARDYDDFLAAFEAGAHACAAGALWAFTDATPALAKQHLAGHGVRVRL